MHKFPPRQAAILALLLLAAGLTGGAPADSPVPAGPPAQPVMAGPEVSRPGPLPLYEVDLRPPDAWSRLQGVQADLVSIRPGFRALVLGWPGTLEALEAAGLCPILVTGDHGADRAAANGVVPRVSGLAAGASAQAAPVPPFGEGSLAGFWTYDEVAALLDSLAANDTANILTEVDTIGTSHLGIPLLAIGVAGPGKPLGSRPEVLFTSLTHAREPQGMQSALYFLLALMNGYGADPLLTYLVDEREIWFVPVVNPDGYRINEATWLEDGSYGYWRKNARNNDTNPKIDFHDGVDLNRNYGYQWGYDDIGSSPNPTSETYRGPYAFSEPETQAVRDFCLAHEFRTADNLHSFHEASLHPWGYISSETPDSAAFIRLGDAITEADHYGHGHSGQILYPVNGDATDWMYGDASKPNILAFLTEIGNQDDEFWPSQARILPLAQLTFSAHLAVAYAAGVYLAADSLLVEDPAGILRPGETRAARFRLEHIGASSTTSGGITVHAVSDHPGLTLLDDEAFFPDLSAGQGAWPLPGGELLLQADPSAAPGTPVSLRLEIADGAGFVGRDTLWLRLGEPTLVFADSGNASLSSWIPTGAWGLEAVAGDSAFTDSPLAEYAGTSDTRLTLDGLLDLGGASYAVLRMRTKWDIEVGFDFATVEVSSDGGATWTPCAGRWTRPGHGTTGGYTGGMQALGTPGYDADRRRWVEEEMDLSAYAGLDSLRLRFRLRSDYGTEMAGWWIDDIAVLAYPPAQDPTAVAELPRTEGFRRPLRAYPNPFHGSSRLRFTLDRPSPYRLVIHDVAGREVRVLSQGYSEAGEREILWDGLSGDGRPLPRGTYFARLVTPDAAITGRLLLLR